MFDNFYAELLRICNVTTMDRTYSLENVDSLGRAEILVTAECEFGIEITNSEVMALKTYGDLEDLVRGKMSCSNR